jgi:hypothetical protein
MNYELIKQYKRRKEKTPKASFSQPRNTGRMPMPIYHLRFDLFQCFLCKGEGREGKVE